MTTIEFRSVPRVREHPGVNEPLSNGRNRAEIGSSRTCWLRLRREFAVLLAEVRRLRDCEEILGEPSLRTAKTADFAGGPRLFGQPFDAVVTILLFAPAESAVADIPAF